MRVYSYIFLGVLKHNRINLEIQKKQPSLKTLLKKCHYYEPKKTDRNGCNQIYSIDEILTNVKKKNK